MARRQQFHNLLKTITDNVYFQPPINVQIQYPCIIYKRDFATTTFADNSPYDFIQRYLVTIIDKDPDSDIPSKVAKLPRSIFNRFYTAENLNHDVFTVYY